MNKKKKVRQNLNALFDEHYNRIKEAKVDSIFEDLIRWNPECYDIDESRIKKLYSKEDITRFEGLKLNQNLITTFNAAKQALDITDKIVEGFQSNLINAFQAVQETDRAKQQQIQSFFLTYDYTFFALLSALGKEEYPILEKPAYFKIKSSETAFGKVGVDYTSFWKEYMKLDELFESFNLIDDVYYSTTYQGLINAYKFKTYLLLFEVFEQLAPTLFHNLPLIKPLYIYGHEHDCEVMNIYVFE